MAPRGDGTLSHLPSLQTRRELMSGWDQAVPYLFGHNHPPYNPLAILSLSARATVVEIGYRLSSKDPYPKPIHDVTAGYDWIRTHLSPNPSKYNNTESYRTSPVHLPNKPLGICGELAGGSLAAMLALTECKPNGITTTALNNPIIDWSSPLHPPNQIDSKLNHDITHLRTTSFSNPQHRYDPFASPLLFFRTPAYELPTPQSPYHTPPSPSPKSEKSSSDSDPPSSELLPRRLSHRKHPPLGSTLRFPMTRIEVSDDFMLRTQAMEFAALMQRSVNLYGDDPENGRKSLYADDNRENERQMKKKKRVEVVERDGGEGLLWGEKEVMEMGSWMEEMLRRKL
ncbi:MAG: hypothetical protein Q9178_002927 [Gyalolechia marmorata]